MAICQVIDYPTMEVIWNEEFPSTAPIKAIRFLNDRPQCLALGFASADLIVVNLANKKVQKSGRLLVKNVQVCSIMLLIMNAFYASSTVKFVGLVT